VKGEGLRTACMNEVKVLVGSEPCNVTVITDRQLQCKPPLEQPPGYDNYHLPRVTVSSSSSSSRLVVVVLVGLVVVVLDWH